MYFPNFILKIPSSIYIFISRDSHENFSEATQKLDFSKGVINGFFKITENLKDSSFKRCAIFSNFPKMSLIFPIQRGSGLCPKKGCDSPDIMLPPHIYRIKLISKHKHKNGRFFLSHATTPFLSLYINFMYW